MTICRHKGQPKIYSTPKCLRNAHCCKTHCKTSADTDRKLEPLSGVSFFLPSLINSYNGYKSILRNSRADQQQVKRLKPTGTARATRRRSAAGPCNPAGQPEAGAAAGPCSC